MVHSFIVCHCLSVAMCVCVCVSNRKTCLSILSVLLLCKHCHNTVELSEGVCVSYFLSPLFYLHQRFFFPSACAHHLPHLLLPLPPSRFPTTTFQHREFVYISVPSSPYSWYQRDFSQMSQVCDAVASIEASLVTKTSLWYRSSERYEALNPLISLITTQLFLPSAPITAILMKTPDVPI